VYLSLEGLPNESQRAFAVAYGDGRAESKHSTRGFVLLTGFPVMNTRLKLLSLMLTVLTIARAEEKPVEADAKPVKPPVVLYDPKALEVLRGVTGQVVTLEGTLVRVGESKSGTYRYLNFTKLYRESVSLVFPIEKNPEEFKYDKIKAWVGKKVRATGTLSEYGSDLQMIIEKWDQIVEVQ
jgi:hypothetical protein